MKKSTYKIIVLAIIIGTLLIYIGYESITIFNDYKATKQTEKVTKASNTDITPKNNTNENTIELGEELTVKVANKIKLPFYLIDEDDNTYTLIAKESLGKTAYYEYDDCNSSNTSGCDTIKKSELDIDEFLKEKTQDWKNVGLVKIPSTEDISNLKNLLNASFWLYNQDDNKNLKVSYYDNKNHQVENDTPYNEHEIIPIIQIVKSYVTP